MAEAADFQGIDPSPARHWLRRAAAAAVVVPLLAGLVQLPLPPAAAVTAPAVATAAGARTVTVSLDTLSPSAPVKGDALTLSGTVTNGGRETVSRAQIDVRLGARLSSRGAIEDAARRVGFSQGRDGRPLGDTYLVELPEIPSGTSREFTLAVPVDKLGLDDPGVYQLGVSLSGRTPSEPYDQVLGIDRTFLPWQPTAAKSRTQVTVLWPLISSPRLSAETGSDDQQTPVLESDDLAAELAPGGRLERMVALGAELPVTWVVDPDLLATAEAMTRDYQVKSEGTTAAGRNQTVAKQWLNSLSEAVRGDKVIALPYGDPDLASLAHRGRRVSGSLSHLRPATELAESTVETILHVKPSVEYAWPADGAVDPSIVDVATSAGADRVITRSDSMREHLSYTPNAARPIGGGTTAVVSDAVLSTAFEGDMSRAGDSAAAIQKFLAHTLAVTHERPDTGRSVVVAPQRMPTASQAESMASALRVLGSERWSQPSDLIAATTVKPDPRATTSVPSARKYPRALSRQELPETVYRQVRNTRDDLENFQVILTAADRVVTPFGNAIKREMSTSWRGRPQRAVEYGRGVQAHLESLAGEVKLIEKSDLTLSGRSATIPVTVQNKLVQGVEHLVLRLRSTKPTRLKLNGGETIAELPVRIEGGHSQSVKFTASANANGPVPVEAQLYTEDGRRYGAAMTFTVKVSEITSTVMLVIAGGVLLLVLAGVRMYSQRKRAAARRDDAGTVEETGPEPVAGSADPVQPSDPATDTGPQSTDPSGPGEKVEH
ncbi:DUF6049 family protein [Streptomyces somaliensis DSM 40738]|uniref:Uncharacterized protein n=1 Tax=Streptomyces somaliensis (strain ATCC 33201 / DSM 40738 / JCM 12659 / KCTC 9044 / NCTC 11332 / NRRL B-12077 / IP 733) TaxID=1134445 RepID=A0AA44DB43_STRE0|nr:DUF6049 family protein [Streptomyces somaliensis]MCQ0024729.1 DUF6049 family protein [Streptomyces somaliensis DSM 40738]NKY13203.1 hypothetical protein [Streptomyces somaliensis DSM 40738]